MPGTSYPIVLTKLDLAPCVVVGGGTVAERKVAALLDSAALVTVISPELTVRLQEWAEAGRLTHIGRTYCAGDLDGAALAIAATDDPAVNDEVAHAARRAGILVNVAGNPAAGTFTTVATVRRGDVLATVSTNGASPTLAALLRRRIEALIGPEYAELLAMVRVERSALQHAPADVRQHILDELLSEPVLDALREGKNAQVEQQLAALLDAAQDAAARPVTEEM